jgi:PAS domain-containing protein
MRGRLVVTMEGAYVDADETALELLGLTIDELRTHRIGDFAGPHADVARAVWHRYASARRPLPTGEASIHPPGRPAVRVRYDAVAPQEDGRYILDFMVLAVGDGPPVVDDLHAVLEEWRASERDAAERRAGGDGQGTEAEADGLRRLYGLGSAAKTREA